MTHTKKLPVIDDHSRDGWIIGYAETSEQATAILRAHQLDACDGEPDESTAGSVHWYSKGTQAFNEIEDADLVNGYWAVA